MGKLNVGLFFGGRSTEHEVSVITALQAYNHLDKSKYDILPIYISKDGILFTNPKFLDLKNYKDIKALLLSSNQVTLDRKESKPGLRTSGVFSKFIPLDVAFPLFHGSFGEDGAVQGLFEVYQLPYVGFGVTGSSLSMDKVAQKAIYKNLGLNIGKYFSFKRSDWNENSKKIVAEIKRNLKFPIFVKPALIGSSIGVNSAKDTEELSFAIEVAATYSDKILIEEAFQNCFEVNCSALGYKEVKASVCEMPVASSEVLSFQDKYQRGSKGSKGSKSSGMASLQRIIPAPIPEKLTKQIQDATIQVFKALDGCGVARVDYFVNKEKTKFWVNEINSIPGSLAFYLWEKTDIKYPELLDILISLALERAEDQKKTQYTFDSGLLSQMAEASSYK